MHALATQIEIAIFEADIFGIIRFAGDRHGQFFSCRLHLDRFGAHFDLAGVELGIDQIIGSRNDLAGYGDNRLRT